VSQWVLLTVVFEINNRMRGIPDQCAPIFPLRAESPSVHSPSKVVGFIPGWGRSSYFLDINQRLEFQRITAQQTQLDLRLS
jgi:hypothetical protein